MGYTLTTSGKALLTKAVTAHTNIDSSDKSLFEFAYKEYKSVTKGDRSTVTSELKKHVEFKTESVNIQQAVLKVFRVALKYVDMQVITKFDLLEYTNIRSLVILFAYMDTKFKDDAIVVREQVKKVYTDDMSPHRYNNTMVDTIKTIKAKYKVVETVEGEAVTISYSGVVASVMKLSTEDKAKLLEMLLNETPDLSEVA